MAILIALFLTFSMTASTMLMPNANAHTPAWKIPTEAFCNVAPNPAGVGQALTVGFWLQMPPPTASTAYGDRYKNMTVKVTHPDGTTETLGPFTSDDTGGTFTLYTPTLLGNYTFQMSFPGQTLAGNNPPPGGFGGITPIIGDYLEPSVSNIVSVTVQQAALPTIPFNSLPTTYWTRPINAENNNWYSIGGNWLGLGSNCMYNASGNYNPYTLAPTTAHIMWTKPIAFGGTVGGEFGGSETSNFYTNRQYDIMFKPIIMDGVLYYTLYPTGGNNYNINEAHAGWVAVDLQTGQTLWTTNTPLTASGACTVLLCGQLLDYVSPNQYGVSAYLWSQGTPVGVNSAGSTAITKYAIANAGTTTYNMFDAFDGSYILSIVNGSAMTLTEDQSGDLIGYYVNSSTANAYHAPTLNMWNSTLAIINYQNITGPSISVNYANLWNLKPIQGSQIPFGEGIEWSVPLPTKISGNPLPVGLGISAIQSGVIIMTASSASTLGGSSSNSPGGYYQVGWIIEAGYNANTGAQLWITNRTETPFTVLGTGGTAATAPWSLMDGSGVYVEANTDTFTLTGYSDYTGAQLWTKVLPDANTYDSLSGWGMVANGTLYYSGLGGDVYAVNILTGTILWHYNTGTAGANTPYGVWPIWASAALRGYC